VLFGPCELGGLGIDNLRTILTTTRLNYFLYHTRQGTQVGKKLETSAAHLQIEIGTSKPFFQSNYDQYGHLATPTLNTCLWAETEPYGLTIRGHSEALWCPTLQGSTDLAIMELAVAIFNPDSSYKINRCRIHLQLFTVYDLYLNSGSMILSELRKGQRLRSRKPLVNWPELPKPPRSYWKVWNDFLAVVEQYITTKGFCHQTRNPHFLHTFYPINYNHFTHRPTKQEYPMSPRRTQSRLPSHLRQCKAPCRRRKSNPSARHTNRYASCMRQ